MNQSELIAKVAALSGETRKSVEAVLKASADVIGSTLKEGGDVTLPGLGKLYVKERAARTGFNPKTKEPIQIPAGKSPGFKAAKALKDAVGGAQ
ncbi:MAG: HU family DNA-binding protein [Dechloromonas sp.]|nr:HU family DNA-binding protein [Dechloromonas sp.]